MPKPASLLALALVLAAAAGCGGGDTTALELKLDRLQADLREARDERDRAAARLDALERRLGGLQQDLSHVRTTAVEGRTAEAVPAPEPGAEPALAAPAAAPAPEEPRGIAAYLASEAGQEAVEGALRAVEARRREERQQAVLDRMMAGFAERAQLTPDQQARMTDIVGRSMGAMREVWSGMRDGELTPEERATAREENLRKMEEIRARTDDEVKSVLSSTQFEIYQQDTERFRNAARGGFGPPGLPGGGARVRRPNDQ